MPKHTPPTSDLCLTPPTPLATVMSALASEPSIAVDTESDSLFSYFEKTCLLQFSTRERDFILDPLNVDAAPLSALFADAQIEKVFHAAEYDIFCLKRDYQFEFVNLFDTMIAARILGWKNVGLGTILQERFGVLLNKKMQRADWGHRPLTREHLDYAREDTHFLLALRDLQIAELDKMGRLVEAREEFERLTHVEPTPRRFDPDAYWNMTGARDLDGIGLGILRELYQWRDTEARKQDRPPFKILNDSALLHCAVERPTSTRGLAQMSGISSYILQRYSDALLRAIERGRQAPQAAPPHPVARHENQLDPAARNRLGKLKEWRKARAAERGVETDVIVPNDALIAIARKNPRTLEALIEISGLGDWKANAYAEELFNVLHKKRK